MGYKLENLVVDRVAILGGGGFIGTNLCQYILNKKIEVHVLSRSWLQQENNKAVSYITADVCDRNALEKLIQGCNTVFVLAHGSTPSSSMENITNDLLSVVPPIIEIMKLCVEYKARLIFISSGGTVYGSNVPLPTPEDIMCLPITGYGVSKLTIEKYLHVFQYHYGLEYRVIRVANPYGPWQFGQHGQGVIGEWLKKIIHDEEIEIWGDGQIIRDYIYIDDVVKALWKVTLYEGDERVFNIASGCGYSLMDIIELLSDIERITLKYCNKSSRPSDIPVSILDISKAERQLGWRPEVSFEVGLFLTWQWIESYYKYVKISA